MIVWTTAREVEFEKVCSTLETQDDSYETVQFGRDAVNEGNGVTFFRTTATFAEGGATQGETSYGTTTNQTGVTQSFSSSNSFSNSASGSSLATFTSFGTTTSETVTITNIDSSASNSTSGSNSFSSSSSFGLTFSKETTTTETLEVYGTTTSSSTQESTQWTTVQTFSDTNVTEFVPTEAVGTYYFVEATSLTRTRTVTTESETTKGNARDTIYMADSSEVLLVINEDPDWSKPLTDNVVSTTQTTISDLREATELVTASDPPETIESSESLSSYTFTSSSASSITATVNSGAAFVNAETVTSAVGISIAGESQSGELRVSGQPEVIYVGGTETVAASSATIATATQTDVFGESWQKTALVYSTVTNTISINNAVETFTISEGTTSSCYGNTTKEVGFVGGSPAIASPPSMTVYSPAGVKLGDGVGLRFTGDGISETDIEEGSTITLSYLRVANDGELTRYTTASPVVPSWFTLSSNSFTYLATTLEDGETVDTEISGEFGIDGATWQTVARSRGNGLIGGDLAESETALMRINRGLYKNQDGDTSFFEGNDTTYVGTKDTTYWYPISYLEPAFEQLVLAVPRNTSTWPTFAFMP
jgi:hypothetical protein